MERYYYIKKGTRKSVMTFAEDIAEKGASVGSTMEDYESGKWVALNDSQIAFYNDNKTARATEVFNMELTPVQTVEPTLEEVKFNKIMEIEQYDRSEKVNSFSIDGNDMWLTVDERQQIATQISASEAVGRTEMTRWFNGKEFTFPIATWKLMLAVLEVYAGDALNTTEAHKAAVNAMSNIEDIEKYDYTTGYPTKLSF